MSIYPYRGFQKCIHHIKDSVCVSRWKWKGIRNDKLSGARLALRKTGRVSCKGIVYNRISNGKQSSVYSSRTMSKRRHCTYTIEFFCFSRQVFYLVWRKWTPTRIGLNRRCCELYNISGCTPTYDRANLDDLFLELLIDYWLNGGHRVLNC
jgi:hypothetical protein